MTPERLDELIALAALGEISDAEQRELDQAARLDPAVARELDEALAAAAALQRRGGMVPPAGLRANVLGAIAATPQVDSPTPELVVTPIDEARRTRRWVWPAIAAAAAVLAIVAGGLLIANDVSAPDQYEAIVDAADAETHTLSGDLGGTLQVTYSPSHSALVLEGDDIATLGDDETYQLWVDIDGHMTPAGLFRPTDDGRVRARIDDVATTGASINVTAEPAGGSETPTLPVLASA